MNQRIAIRIVGLLSWSIGIGASASVNVPGASPALAQLHEQVAVLSRPFVPNAGQWDRQAAFGAQTLAGTLFVTTDGRLVYSLPGKPLADRETDAAANPRAEREAARRLELARTPGWVLTETFVGAAKHPIDVRPSGERPATAKVSYFIGHDERNHRRGLDTFERINLGEVFPGINVRLRATGNNVEKIFTITPHHDPGQIRLRIGGASRLELGPIGELIAHTGNGPLSYTAPIAFQEDSDGRRQPVAVRYALDSGNHEYGFALAAYDTSRPLVIDPLIQSTYLGTGGLDAPRAIAIDPANGDVYVAGLTSSFAFPGVDGGAGQTFGGNPNYGFIARFSADLTTLRQSTYVGAPGDNQVAGLAIHPVTSEVYVTGFTTSASFPGLAGGAQQIFGGGTHDAFVSRFSADLTTLIRSTYLGAAGSDEASGLAIHPVSGDVYVVGSTTSSGSTFPVANGAQQNFGGVRDAFVSRFKGDLSAILLSSYLGAAGAEDAWAVAIHPASGDIYVAGGTTSATNTFPGVSGGAQTSYGGIQDAFVSRFNADLFQLIRSTYLGGTGADVAFGLAIHPVNGDVYLTGRTGSNPFPGVGGGFQDTFGGGTDDAFVSRLSPDLSTLRNSSYFGAGGVETGWGVAIHPVSRDIYLAGSTSSPTNTLPGAFGGAQGSSGGAVDGFIARFNPELTILFASSYLGAAGNESSALPAIHPINGDLYIAGETTSTGTTFPGVGGGAQGTFGGGSQDAFVSRLTLDLRSADVVPNAFKFAAQGGVPMNVMRTSAPVQITGLGAQALVTLSGAPGSGFCASTTNDCSCNLTFGAWFAPGMLLGLENNRFLCLRHASAPVPNGVRETVVVVGGAAAKFVTSTGSLLNACALDVDGNAANDALTDGLMIIRALFGLTGTGVTNNAVGAGAARATWAQLRAFMNGNCGTNFAQ